MQDIRSLTNWDSLIKKLEDKEKSLKKTFSENEIVTFLQRSVKGQDEVLAQVAKILRMNLAKNNTDKPIANLLFLGPTGTGKTELAKALSRFFFNSEDSLIRFDCSELADASMAKTRLVGSPLGYVGSESGGQLTRPMFSNKKRIILFDEIEKAHPLVFDLFLQLMGEGRLTEQGTGRTADFSESIIIMTSNSQAEKIVTIKNSTQDKYEQLNEIKSHLVDTNLFRPEIMGRVDKVCVFDALKPEFIAEISLLKLQKLARDYSLEVKFIDPEALIKVMDKNLKVAKFGIRELERILDDEFAEQFILAKEHDCRVVQISKEGKVLYSKKPKLAS